MDTVGVTAYTVGITHTYVVKEKLEQAARKLGYTCRIKAQGNIGMEEQLIPGEIEAADMTILTIDVKVSGENRFKGKPMVHISTEKAMKNTGALFQNIEEALTKKKSRGN